VSWRYILILVVAILVMLSIRVDKARDGFVLINKQLIDGLFRVPSIRGTSFNNDS
jgi:uncharacterized membrane protein YciS (DUF1049 family)